VITVVLYRVLALQWPMDRGKELSIIHKKTLIIFA
jgi:hypothetical protein